MQDTRFVSGVVVRAGALPGTYRDGASHTNWLDTLAELVQSPTTAVLFTGGGVGAAKRLHRMTWGKTGAPFVHVDCAWLRELDAGRLLFGIENGASVVPGFVERANGGTLFLDNIDLLAAPEQAALSEFLARLNFRRAGGALDVRVSLRLAARVAGIESAELAADLRAKFRVL